MDVNWTYCGNHFAIYTNIKSLCCTPETIPQLKKKKKNPKPESKYVHRNSKLPRPLPCWSGNADKTGVKQKAGLGNLSGT